jgi:hypothetical protein
MAEVVEVVQYEVEDVKELLFQQGATPDDASILIAIAYLESKFKHGIDGDTDPNDKGLWQINPPQYFDGENPDNMVKAFYGKQGETLSLEEFTNKVKYDIDYATAFAVHIVGYRRANPRSYGPDPFDAWTTYKEYVKDNMSRLAPTDELIFKNGLDSEITKAISYIKEYNTIPFGKPKEEIEIDDTPPSTTTTTTTIPTEETEIDTSTRSEGVTNMFGTPPQDDTYQGRYDDLILKLIEAKVNRSKAKAGQEPVKRNLLFKYKKGEMPPPPRKRKPIQVGPSESTMIPLEDTER